MTFSVVIERQADGKRVVCPQGEWDDEDGATLFYWTDGNMACDCNRRIQFDNADGAQRPENVVCGETEYVVIEYRLSDGRVIPGHEDRKPS